MDITCIADLHGHYPNLEGGDLLIVAGDLTARDTEKEYRIFREWIRMQDYDRKIFIGGNHDNWLQKKCAPCPYPKGPSGLDLDAEYLCDSGTEFEGLKIWGFPHSLYFEGINPECTAFTGNEEYIQKKCDLIPDNIDILVCHSPPYGILDRDYSGKRLGSKSLQMELFLRVRPRLFICGNIHEAYGICPKGGFIENVVNCSHVNQRYEPVNKPIRIEL